MLRVLLFLPTLGCSFLLSEAPGPGTGPDAGQEMFCGDELLDDQLESCEDGNQTAGDGCDLECQIENGFSCPDSVGPCKAVTGAMWSTSAPASQIGTAGGGVVINEDCASNEFVTSLTTDPVQCLLDTLSLFSITCSQLAFTAGVARTTDPRETAPVGVCSSGAPLLNTSCPSDSVAVGLRGAATATGMVQALELVCAPIEHLSGDFVFGATTISPLLGHPGGTARQVLCPSGTIMVGYGGRAGDVIEHLFARCAAISATAI